MLTNAILCKISEQRRMTATSYDAMFDIGYPLQIRGQIIILPVKLITAKELPGSLKAKLLVTGNRHLPYCGSMAFVGLERLSLAIANHFQYHSGIGKNRPLVWVVAAISSLSRLIMTQLNNHPGYP